MRGGTAGEWEKWKESCCVTCAESDSSMARLEGLFARFGCRVCSLTRRTPMAISKAASPLAH